jgi:hypothetical protein
MARAQIGGNNIENISHYILSTIERCPVEMMIPENVRNAFQAVEQMPMGGEVHIRAIPVIFPDYPKGVEKLSIYNPGSQVTKASFPIILRLISSENKKREGSFGIGAKTSTWGSQPCGVRYRCCDEGQVMEAMVTSQYDPNGKHFFDVSNIYSANELIDAEGTFDLYNLSENFFEVTFYGMSEGQETCKDLYGDGTRVDLANALWLRFYEGYPDVSLKVQKELLPTRVGSDNIFRPIGSFFENPGNIMFKKGKCESVPVTTGKYAGAVIDYGYDPNTLVGHGLFGSRHSMCAMVFQKEMFNVSISSKNERGCQHYSRVCYKFGIHPELSKYFYVFFKFPDNGTVMMDMNRKNIQHCDSKEFVTYDDIYPIIDSHMPKWGLELCREYNQANSGNLMDKINDLMNTFNMRREVQVEAQKKAKLKRNVVNPRDPNGVGHSRGTGLTALTQRNPVIADVPMAATYEILTNRESIDNIIGNDYIAINQYTEKKWNRFYLDGTHSSIYAMFDMLKAHFPKHLQVTLPETITTSVEEIMLQITQENILYDIIETVLYSQNEVNNGDYRKDSEPFFLNAMIKASVHSKKESLFKRIRKEYKETAHYRYCSGSKPLPISKSMPFVKPASVIEAEKNSCWLNDDDDD